MMASPFHCPQNGDPPQMLPIPVLHLTVRMNLSIHSADLTVPTAGLFLKRRASMSSEWGIILRKCTFDLRNSVGFVGRFARTSVTQTLISENNTRAAFLKLYHYSH